MKEALKIVIGESRQSHSLHLPHQPAEAVLLFGGKPGEINRVLLEIIDGTQLR
jgi:hypothetical protein